MKTIKRTIYVDCPEQIDYDNIGCHFTSDLCYEHKGGGSNGVTVEKLYKITIYTKNYVVNEEATAISNENYPGEKEIVLEMNQKIKAQIFIAKHNGFGYGFCKPIDIVVNTGERADVWVKSIK